MDRTPFDANMGWKEVLVFVTLIATCLSLQEVTVTSGFRRLGSLATGLSYAHIHGEIDFRGLQRTQRAVTLVMDERLQKSTSTEESMLVEALRPQLVIAEKTIADLQALFFGHPTSRPKRQLFLGLAVALGLTSVGTSIYTATEVSKLHRDISSLKSDVQHVAHVLDQEALLVNRLAADMHTVSKTCQLVLGRILQEDNRITMLTGVMGLTSLVNNFNADLSAWGRGLEALANGKLHPALTDHRKLQHAIAGIDKKAKAKGRRILHEGESAVFKAPVSYLATDEGKIIFIVHVALVETKQMDLFEFISTPVKVRDLVLEVRASQRILAIDDKGQTGIEMSHDELIRCQTEEKHDGQVFLCPNANLIRNDVRKTCLGGVFFGLQEEIASRCDHVIHRGKTDEVRQTGKNEILIFSERNQTLIEKCSNGTRYHWISEGLVARKVESGCEISTKDFTFKALKDIDSDDNFLRREVQTGKFAFLQGKTDNELREALKALQGLKEPELVNVDQLESWIREQEQDSWTDKTTWTLTGIAALAGFLAICAILLLFAKHKLSSKANEK